MVVIVKAQLEGCGNYKCNIVKAFLCKIDGNGYKFFEPSITDEAQTTLFKDPVRTAL